MKIKRIGYKASGNAHRVLWLGTLRHYMLSILTVVQWVFGIR